MTTWSRRIRIMLAALMGSVVAAMGYLSSFDNLRDWAARAGFTYPAALPIGVDFAIPALLLLDSLWPSRFLRGFAWFFTAATVIGNAYTVPDASPMARAGHAILPLASAVFFDAFRRQLLPPDPARMDRIRWTRYLVAPVRTVRLRARMIAWEITSYRDALAREAQILYARTVLTAEYGARSWKDVRQSVPLSLRHQLDTGQLPDQLLYGTDWHAAVRTWVLGTLDELDPHRHSAPVQTEAVRAGPEAGPVMVIEREPWDQVWDHLDQVRVGLPNAWGDNLSDDQLILAYGVARRWWETEGDHIKGHRLQPVLGIAKPRANALADALRNHFETAADQRSGTRTQEGPDGTVQPAIGTGASATGPSGPSTAPKLLLPTP